MKPFADYGETITSGQMQTGAATIELTPEMFTLLSDGMYQDKILAPIRESICNARDVHVENDVDLALEVHAPNRLEPYFHVRDFGTGLTERQILGYIDEDGVHQAGLYLRYGKSTKRDSNLQIGGFGIGCKAPLAYSDSFIVESYQGGVVKTYTIYKEAGIPNVAKLSEQPTDQLDGLKVKIAVASQDTATFVNSITEFLRYFNYDVGTTGQSIVCDPSYIMQTDSYDTVSARGYSNEGTIKASMGGVLYSVSSRFEEDLQPIAKKGMLIMKFNIGELSVAGSRETLSEDTETVAKLEETVKQIKDDFYSVMKDEIAKAKTPYKALTLLRQYDLIRSDWRKGKEVAVKAASEFKIDGMSIDDAIDKYNNVRVRSITGGTKYSSSDYNTGLIGMREVPTLLEVDRGSGYIKVARQLSDETRRPVVLSIKTDIVATIKEYFGDELKVESASVLYLKYFPKGAPTVGKVKVARSGLFNTDNTEVTELDETQKGVYIPFERMSCIIDGKPANQELGELTKINKLMLGLIEAGQVEKDELFYARKTGMRAVGKTELKELTWDSLIKLCRKSYTLADYKAFVMQSTHRTDNPATSKHKALSGLWENVKHNYPTWNQDRVTKVTKGLTFLNTCGIVSLLEPTVAKDQSIRQELYRKEETQFETDYSILSAFGSSWWRFSDDTVEDIVAFCEWKGLGKKLKNVA